MPPGMLGKDESYYLLGFKNELQQIIPPTLSISGVQSSNKFITTNRISRLDICQKIYTTGFSSNKFYTLIVQKFLHNKSA